MSIFNRLKTIFKNDEEIKKYEEGLEKTRKDFVSKLNNLSERNKKINEEYFEELEEILIGADIGVETVVKFVDNLAKRVKEEGIVDSDDLKEIIVDELFILYVDNQSLTDKLNYSDEISVFLFIGVNGVGKTTSIAKLAKKMKDEGRSVVLVAGDTFRAGAVEQLQEWGSRLDVPVISSDSNDPSSVIYDGISYAKENSISVVLIDTAGRLQNKVNLMEELKKINNVIGKLVPDAPHETLLVVDATTGQNGISQAKSFNEITKITGIILTKLDGTAKGGIVIAIKDAVKIPVKFVGFGEKLDDLKTFDIEKYIYGLFREW